MIIFDLPKFICHAETLARIFLTVFSEQDIDSAWKLVSFATDLTDCGPILILSLINYLWSVILSGALNFSFANTIV